MAIIVGQLPANVAGRDIIIGDLQRHPEFLHRLLDQVTFNPPRGRFDTPGDNILFEPVQTVIWGLENRKRKRMLIGDQTKRISP